jgi:Tol biopolymer transport system component
MSSNGVHLYDLQADKATRVLEGPYMAAQLSPNGRQLLVDYRNGSAAEWELWVVDIAAAAEASAASAQPAAVYPPKNATLVAKNGFSANWSPDGNEIVYGLTEGQGIEILNLQTQERRIVHSQGKDPRWSPDGRWIAFIKGPSFNDYANETVWLVAPDVTSAREVGRGSYVNWIEGGKRLVYYSRDQQRQFVVEVDEPQAQPQVFHAGSPPYASVSPDGKHIAYSQGAKVHVIDLAKREELAYPGLLERFGGLPSWSGDGRLLAIGYLRSRDSGLWLYDLTTNQSTPLLKGPYVRPAFSPDGTKLLFDYAPGVEFKSWQVWMMDLPSQ